MTGLQAPEASPLVQRPGARDEIVRFLVVGVLTVLVDFVSYRLLLAAGLDTSVAKAIGFVTGTVFAYFANRRWTFAGARSKPGSAWRFAALYATTLAINVLVNAAMLQAARSSIAAALAVPTAFVVATGISAVLNFVGMKFFVFHARP